MKIARNIIIIIIWIRPTGLANARVDTHLSICLSLAARPLTFIYFRITVKVWRERENKQISSYNPDQLCEAENSFSPKAPARLQGPSDRAPRTKRLFDLVSAGNVQNSECCANKLRGRRYNIG
jgi:hypothetical protein